MSREEGQGLICPKCGSGALYVNDTRHSAGYVRRRRACDDCGNRATTYEVIEQLGDPAGTRIGDILQLREQMMKLRPEARMVVRRLILYLVEGGTKIPSEPPILVPLTDSEPTPERLSDEEPTP